MKAVILPIIPSPPDGRTPADNPGVEFFNYVPSICCIFPLLRAFCQCLECPAGLDGTGGKNTILLRIDTYVGHCMSGSAGGFDK